MPDAINRDGATNSVLLLKRYLQNERESLICGKCQSHLSSDMCDEHDEVKFKLDQERAAMLKNIGHFGDARLHKNRPKK